MRNTTIPVRFIGSYGTDRLKLDALFGYKMPIFYGTKEDETKLRSAVEMYNLLFDENDVVTGYSDYDKQFNRNHYRSYNNKKATSKRTIMFLQLAQNNIKYMEYCYNAIHIDQFFMKMLYRKDNVVKQYFQTFNLIEKYNQLGNLYQDDFFTRIDAVWGAKIQNLNQSIDAIPEQAKNDRIGRYRYQLEKYFDLKDIKMTKEQNLILKEIDEIAFLKEANEKTLSYVYLRSDLENADAEMIKILKKVMAL